MVTPIFFISFQSKRNFLSIKLLNIQKLKNRQMLCKSRNFGMCCISKIIKNKHFIFLELIANQKNNRGYHIPMIDVGKSKEVTAVKL